MDDTGALDITGGLKEGDVFIFDLACQTIMAIRPNDPANPSEGYRTLRWPNGGDKKLVQCVTDRGSFLDFMMLVADTHGLVPVRDEDRPGKLILVLNRR